MKIDLQSDQQQLREYILARIQNYVAEDNIGPGEPGDAIGLITLGFYAEQGGYANLVFDTRLDADVDGSWTIHIDNDVNLLEFPDWYDAYMAVCESEAVTFIRYDGSERRVKDNDISDEDLNELFGEMLTNTLQSLRDDGSLAKLPLSECAFMVVEEFDGRYFWPTYESRNTAGRIHATNRIEGE